MPLSFTNISKNSISPTYDRKADYAIWDDPVRVWDDSAFFWDSPLNAFGTNVSKNSISPTNITKN